LSTLLAQGRARLGSGDLLGADTSLQSALRLAQRNFGAGSLETARSLWGLGELRHAQGRFNDAEGLYKRGLTLFETQHASPTDVSWLLDDLAKIYEREQQWALAKLTYERALDIDRHLLGEDHPRIAVHLHNLAFVTENLGELIQAEVLYRDAISRQERIYGDHHPVTASFWGNFGLLLQREGRLGEAEPYLRRALAVMLSLYGPNHFDVAYNRVSVAMLLHEKGDLNAAESEYRQALAVYDKTLPPDHQWRASALMHLARLLAERGKAAEAADLSAQSIRIWTDTSPPGSPKTAQAHAIHGYAQLLLGQAPAALREIESAYAVIVQARGANDLFAQRVSRWLKEASAAASAAAGAASPAASPAAG
jgi:tetratricopeptide (TPR) repeat protein